MRKLLPFPPAEAEDTSAGDLGVCGRKLEKANGGIVCFDNMESLTRCDLQDMTLTFLWSCTRNRI